MTQAHSSAAGAGQAGVPLPRGAPGAKPTVESLGVDIGAQSWQRSGDGDGAIEIAFVSAAQGGSAQWVLMRVAADPAGRVLVYDRHEWECFLDGARKGEFDEAAGRSQLP